MNRALDPQLHLLLAALTARMKADAELIRLLGEAPGMVIARSIPRDPITVTMKDETATYHVETSGIPCLAVYNDGRIRYEGMAGEVMFHRKVVVEWIGHQPADLADGSAMSDEMSFAAAGIIASKIVELVRVEGTVNAPWGQVDLYGDYIDRLEPTGFESYVLRLDRMFGVEVELDVWHAAPPHLITDESVPLATVETEQRHEAIDDEEEIEHDSIHIIDT